MRKDIRRICVSLALLAVIGCCYLLWSRPVGNEENIPFLRNDHANIQSVMDIGEVLCGYLMEMLTDIADISAAKAYLLDKYELIKGIMVPILDRCEVLLKDANAYYSALCSDVTPELWKEKFADWWKTILCSNE